MVNGPRGTADTRRIRQLKSPRAIEVEADDDGIPLRLCLKGTWHDVSPARRPWRIDQHWWRNAISRIYHCVALEDGPPLTIYRDLIDGQWFRQEYR